MVIKKTATKAAAKPAAAAKSSSKASAPSTDNPVYEPITIQRTYTEGGEAINNDPSETIGHAVFPANARTGRVTVTVGTASDFGKLKAGVTISAPYMVEEFEDALQFALNKAQEALDGLADVTAVEDEEEADEPAPAKKGGKASAKKEVTSSRKAGKKAEPEEEEEEADEEDGDDTEVELFDEEELAGMDEDQLKDLCETWEIEWPTAKKASVRKATAIASILEKQAEAAEDEEEADEEDADADEGDEDEDAIGPDEIEAMDRKQVEQFIKEYNDGVDEDEQLEVDLSDYPKNAKGLKSLKADLIGALFSEDEDEE